VELRDVDLRAAAETEGAGPEQALLNAMDDRTRVLAVSSVQWTDGLRLDLGRLGQACRAAGVLFFVDAIQQFGALRIDVRAERIDCLAAGGHKWQMAPEGCGVFYCREAWRGRLKPLKQGWRMLERPFAFDEPSRPVRAGGQRFEPGTPNTLGQFALNASLSLQEDWGQAWIEARILANTERLRSGVSSLPGVEFAGRPPPAPASGIVSLRPTRRPAREVVQRMAERRVIAVARGDLVRLSPHAYQDERVVERVLEALEEAARP
jgi:selenocysteine lyase/cysteine desulfurase